MLRGIFLSLSLCLSPPASLLFSLPPSPLVSTLPFSPRRGCLFVLTLDLVVIRKWHKAAGHNHAFGSLLKCRSLDPRPEFCRTAVEWKGGWGLTWEREAMRLAVGNGQLGKVCSRWVRDGRDRFLCRLLCLHPSPLPCLPSVLVSGHGPLNLTGQADASWLQGECSMAGSQKGLFVFLGSWF